MTDGDLDLTHRARVLAHVRERLLHDPVRRQLDARRDRSRQIAVDHVVGGEGRVTGHELGDRGQRRLGDELRPTVVDGVVAQDAENAPHLVHRLPAGQLDHFERSLGLLRIRRQLAPRRAGLDHHHAHRVRDHIVELSGNARSFLGHALAGEELLLPLGPLRPLGQVLDAVAAAAHIVTDGERGDEHDAHPENVGDLLGCVDRRSEDDQRHDRADDDDGSVATPAGAVGGHRVHRDHHADPAGPERLRDLARELRREHDEEDRDGRSTPPRNGQRRCHHQRTPPHGRRRGLFELRTAEHVRGERHSRHEDREQPVTGFGVSAQPADRVEP